MRINVLRPLSSFVALLVLASPILAAKFKPGDFPLRVHIIFHNGIRHYRGIGGGMSSLDEVDGLGQGNLFENSQPRGFDFNYACRQPITPQTAFETFPARWKKQDRELEILMPVMGGNPGEMNSCELKVSMKPDSVYVRINGGIGEEPAASLKEWMSKHEYDPEHGKNQPMSLPSKQQRGDAQTQ